MSSNSDDSIAVASSIYNLAGPESGRVDFLKSLIIAATQNGSDISTALNQGYMSGPGVRYRQFSNWAQNNTAFTSTFGITSGAIMASPSIDPLTLQGLMNAVPVCTSPQQVDSIQSTDILGAEIQYWVLQYMYANYSVGTGVGQQPVPYPAVPGQASAASTYTYNSTTNLVTITLADGSTIAAFTPAGYDVTTANLNYLYVKYNPAIPGTTEAQVYGPQITLGTTDPDPTYPNPPYLQCPGAESTGTYSASLTTTSVCITTFSNGRAAITNTASPVVETETQPTYYNMWAYDQAPNSGTPSSVPFNNTGQPATINGAEYTIRFYFEYWIEWTIVTQVNTYTDSGPVSGSPGVTYTNTITETAQVLQKVRKTRASSQNLLWTTMLPPQYWIYKYGSGNTAIDALMTPPTPTSLGAFYPPIPFISAKQVVGPLQNTATQWSIEIPWPGFDPATNYYNYQDASGRDIQVADTPTAADEDWVSLEFFGDNTSAGPNNYYCQTLPQAQILPSNSLAAGNGWGPLCTVFASTSTSNPGYFRIRQWVTYPAWATGTYALNAIVYKGSYTYQATAVTGPDNGTGPTAHSLGATTISGGVTWTCIAAGNSGWQVISSGVGSTPTLLPSAPVPDPVGSDYNSLMGTIYPTAKQAFQRAYGGQYNSYDTIQQQVLENADLTNIDYVYAIFGVSLNVQEPACRRYIYAFLKNLLTQQGSNESAWQTFMTQYNAANASWAAWQTWFTTYHNTNGTPKIGPWTDESGQQITPPPPEPSRIPYPSVPWLVCQVQSVHAGVTNYRTDLRYGIINEVFGSGVLQKPTYYPLAWNPPSSQPAGAYPGYPILDMSGNPVTMAASEGDIWWVVEPAPLNTYTDVQIGGTVQSTPDDYTLLNNRVSLYWQYDANNWKQLDIIGLTYENWIYETYKIWYSAAESVNWTQPNPDGTHPAGAAVVESPFVFPMQSSVYASMTMVDSTQMATACTFLIFNCWEKVNLPWYEQTWFQVIVIVVVAIIAVVAAYFSGGASLGAAGAALDAYLGLDAVADLGIEAALLAAVVGALADVVVGVALSYMVSFIIQELFPGETGAIIGAVVGLALALYAGGATSVSSIESMLSTASGWLYFSADLLIAAGKIATAIIDNSIMIMGQETSDEVGAIDSETVNIENLIASTFGDGEIDPTLAAQYLLVEPPATFLTRTLMTGSDIVQATLDQISEYAEVHLQLPLPGVDPESSS